jgi:hypothetical protein
MREFVWGYGVEAGLRVVMNNQCLEDLGLWTQDPSARSWCAQLRDRWRPPLTRVVLLADRVPDPRGPRHFFYAEPITSGDDLYRGVIEALYEESPGRVGEPKEAWLQRLRDDGVFCMDLVEDQLVNRRELAMARAAAAPRLADAVERLAPDGLLAIGSRTLEYVAPSAVALLNDSARVPFPAGAERKQFIAEVRRLVRPLLDRRGA